MPSLAAYYRMWISSSAKKTARFLPTAFWTCSGVGCLPSTDLAEVVGKWVWISFPEQPAEQVRSQLSQFGFHWNNSRKCWQHPCGQFATEGSGADPRQKYGSHFAADLKAA